MCGGTGTCSTGCATAADCAADYSCIGGTCKKKSGAAACTTGAECATGTCEQARPHALLAGAPASLRVPHSRWNSVCPDQLSAKGYQVLTRTLDGSVDTFIRQDAGLSLFFPVYYMSASWLITLRLWGRARRARKAMRTALS